MNPIFEKARAAVYHMRSLGYVVEITTHPTPYGNSAYVTAWLSRHGVSMKSGFRLSDHGVGERRKGLDDFPTIIDGSDVTVESLIESLHIDSEKMDELAKSAAEKRAQIAAETAEAEARAQAEKEARRSEEYAHIERLNVWLAENCPDYDALNKTEKKKARNRANAALYPKS